MLFNNVKGFPDARVTIGMLASRKKSRNAARTDPEFLGKYMGEKLKETIPPVMIPEGKHIDCQEVVHYATDPDFDLRTLVPKTDQYTRRCRPVYYDGTVHGN